jgi:hypothetical protein
MSNSPPPVIQEGPSKTLSASPRPALLVALLICVASQGLIEAFAFPLLDRIPSFELKFLLCLFVPVILAFPVLYRSCLFREVRREVRATLVFLICYVVFGVAVGIWVVATSVLCLVFGVRI